MPGTRRTSRSHTYIVFYKPYGVLSQFTDTAGRKSLGDFGPFPKDVYPVGRLDADSEGLLLLTDDNNIKHHLLDPRYGHARKYLVQVEKIPTADALARLRSGVMIAGKRTREAEVQKIGHEPDVPPREVPIRFRKNVPTSWLEITLTEGRNRQVRRMTAAVGYPALRLVRIAQEPLTLSGMKPGDHRHLTRKELRLLLESLSNIQPTV